MRIWVHVDARAVLIPIVILIATMGNTIFEAANEQWGLTEHRAAGTGLDP